RYRSIFPIMNALLFNAAFSVSRFSIYKYQMTASHRHDAIAGICIVKVLQVIRRLDSVSGSPIQVATLSKYLSETGHPTSIATAFPPHSDLDFSVDVHVIAPNTKNGTSYGKSSAFTAALVDLCEVLQPDIIH